jgi:hypothetical protein
MKSYTKIELALLYNPYLSDAAALLHLRRWIDGQPQLRTELEQIGYNRRRHSFTPREVELIFKYLGEP